MKMLFSCGAHTNKPSGYARDATEEIHIINISFHSVDRPSGEENERVKERSQGKMKN